jgi:hypothetical protein
MPLGKLAADQLTYGVGARVHDSHIIGSVLCHASRIFPLDIIGIVPYNPPMKMQPFIDIVMSHSWAADPPPDQREYGPEQGPPSSLGAAAFRNPLIRYLWNKS